MSVSTSRTRIGPIISALGGTLMMTGISLPLFFTSMTGVGDPNPYPPVLNGWQVISFLPDHFPAYPDLMLLVAVTIVSTSLLAVTIVNTSLLALFQEGSLLVARTRTLATFASIAVLCCFYLFSLLMYLGSWDGGAVASVITLGPGSWPLLLGTVLSAIGVGSASIGAVAGAFFGILIWYLMGSMLPGVVTFLDGFGLSPLTGIVLPIGLPILGSILGGWLLLRRQTLHTSQ